MQNKKLKDKVINDIMLLLQEHGNEVRASDLTTEEQLVQVDVLLDVMKFLKYYEENVKVLNDYWLNKPRFER